ncbi:HEAT repeat domain-containing protein [Metabacillus sp. HB246100]
MIEVSLVFLFVLFISLFFILLTLFLYLLIEKYTHNESKRKIEAYKERYRLDMFHYLQDGEKSPVIPTGENEKFISLVELLSDYSNVLDSKDVRTRISAYAKEYLTDYIKKHLKKSRWSLRMNALFTIEDFHMIHLSDTLHQMYEKPYITSAERTQILKLFAKFNDERIIEYLATSKENFSDFAILSTLSHVEEGRFDELVQQFHQLDIRIQYMVIETIGKLQLLTYRELLQSQLHSTNEEMRIRALKAFANTGAPISQEILGQYFDNESWQVRMMAAKVTGAQKITAFTEQLITLLSDTEYVVRAEAAKAITQFQFGKSMLNKVIEETEDGFARDMALEWLEKERGYN